jgi:hypothetical protein
MSLGVLHRAGVAVMLIAVLLLPYGRCQAMAAASSHDCCVRHSAPSTSVKAECCTIRGQLQAVVSPRTALAPHPLSAVALLHSAAEPVTRYHAASPKIVAGHSPPPGRCVLRI